MDLRVNTWLELQEAVFDNSWQPSLQRFRSNYVFRGTPRASHGLDTSLQTGGFEAHERHLLTSFRKYALRNAVHGDWVWNRALAGQASPPADAPPRLDLLAVRGHALRNAQSASLRRGWGDLVRRLPADERASADAEDVNILTTEMLNRVATTLQAFDDLAKHDFVVFFEPPSLDERIVNQFRTLRPPLERHGSLENLLQRREGAYRRIVIPAALKWEIRDKLDQANITERVLFPGLDGLSQWLKRYFTTRQV